MATVYGTGWLDTAHSKLETALNTLKTAMAAGYDPTFSYVYGDHYIAKLQLNAATVAFDSATNEVELFGDSMATGAFWHMQFTVRVHTDYEGGYQDITKQMRLLNSITNYLLDNWDLSDRYMIENVTDILTGQEFATTLGGQMTVTVSKPVQYGD
jgi:hypothetical protein